MEKILITGCAGFIGFHLCKKLLNLGYVVVGLDNINDYYDINLKYNRLKELGIHRSEAEKENNLVESSIFSKFSFIRLNLEDRENLPNLFKIQNFDYVINLAAQAGVRYSLENPMTYVDSNLVGFVNVLECCRHNEIKHLVYASSSSVYGENDKIPFCENDQVDQPVSLYAATKKANELMAHTYSHLYKLPTSGLRFFTVYGPWGRPDMAPMLFADAMTNHREIKVFNNGEMSRDFTYIDDIVKGIIVTLNHPSDKGNFYQLFNIGNGSPVSLLYFIECMENSLGLKANKKMMPMQAGDVVRTWADTTELNELGYKCIVPIETGVSKFVEWFSDYTNE
ncbi:NAD-dependent epimerase [Chryseobacterium sp.]|uniref:NAD-dependent epimerase n=1 Tax=Chryseobacterium sp. TaxID=1871047 RepID=UPI0023F45054|nr:NAD-dependent epimerase [Chryseobacterium sp.]